MNRRVILLFLVFPVTVGLWAEPEVLTIDRSIASALENNLDFQISRIDLDTAKREADNSWNVFLPSVTAGADLSGSNSITEPESSLTWTATGSIGLSLSLTSSLSSTLKGLKLAYEGESISYETARLTLINSVEKDFYSLLASQADIEIEKTNLELAEKRYAQAERNFSNGLVTELSVLQAKVSAANLKPTYLKAVSDYQIALREFLSAIGMEPEMDVVLDGSLDVESVAFDRDSLIDSYIMNRRDIQAQQNQIEVLVNQKNKAVAGGYVVPSFELSSNLAVPVSDALESSSWSDLTPSKDSFSVGIALEIPLDNFVPGSSKDVEIKGLEDSVKSARLTLQGMIDDARTEIINLVAQLETAAAQVELAELNVELTESTYEKSEESFQQGGMEQLDLEDAKQDYFSAKQDYLESQYDYLTGLIDLRYALGLENLDELTK